MNSNHTAPQAVFYAHALHPQLHPGPRLHLQARPSPQPLPAIPERVFLWRHRCADLFLPFAPVKTKPAITLPTNNGCEPFATNVPRLQKERWNLPTAGYQPLTMRDLPQPARQPLTDSQVKELVKKHPAEDLCRWSYGMGIKDAEAAYGITGGQQ